MLPAILAALGGGEAAGLGALLGTEGGIGAMLGRGAKGPGKEMFFQDASITGSGNNLKYNPATIGSRATPPPVSGAHDKLIDEALKHIQVGVGGLLKSKPSLEKFEQAALMLPSKILEAQQKLVGATKLYVDAASAPIDTVNALGNTLTKFVGQSNPAAVKRFEMQVNNGWATIGHQVEPILDSLTRMATKTADAYAKLEPAITPGVNAIASIVDTMSDTIEPAAKRLAPWMKVVGDQMNLFTGALKAQKPVWDIMLAVSDKLMDITGMGGGWDKDAKGGSAVRPATQVGTEAISQGLSKAALEQGASSGKKKMDDVPTLVDQILSFLNKNLSTEALTKLVTKQTSTGQAISAASSVAGSIADLSPLISLSRMALANR